MAPSELKLTPGARGGKYLPLASIFIAIFELIGAQIGEQNFIFFKPLS